MFENNISIGTAQFGSNYGISNQNQELGYDECHKIIKICKKNNINNIDTAKEYGDAEKLLGKIGIESFKVNTKIKLHKGSFDIENLVLNLVYDSLKKLKIKKIESVMFHNYSFIKNVNKKKIYKLVNILKKKNLVNKIGVSINEFEEIKYLIDLDLFEVVQCPFNILDQRLYKENWINEFKEKNIEIHIRSIFLQGLLNMNLINMPKYFEKWKDKFLVWNKFLNENNISPVEGCLNFINSHKDIDLIVIGVDTSDQLKQIIKNNKIMNNKLIFPSISSIDKNLITPSYWQIS